MIIITTTIWQGTVARAWVMVIYYLVLSCLACVRYVTTFTRVVGAHTCSSVVCLMLRLGCERSQQVCVCVYYCVCPPPLFFFSSSIYYTGTLAFHPVFYPFFHPLIYSTLVFRQVVADEAKGRSWDRNPGSQQFSQQFGLFFSDFSFLHPILTTQPYCG